MLFRNEYAFLSNMYALKNPICAKKGGVLVKFYSVENYFQASKCINIQDVLKIASLSPVEAKRYGRHVALRKDWSEIRVKVMYNGLKVKFAKNPELAEKLKALKDTYIQEDNTWNDYFWGVCRGRGSNTLGKLLMQVRDELK
jgi:ribA/ribD-fused uncharacterized protein